ncbi:hypothetical protein [Pelagibacterium lentulum]|uniref:DUF2213 domain-containing protein n=1 Tax=Pelagibacterium lentulum TaxID=2029865 RepID=A0A916RPH2_9HYPH|nr:hypothetical protein [Pelagibacterium lentulum]GGA64886.1 hypothetical protein GCM10011499_39170 [Pelagibacterium lentulum]
MPQTVRVNVRAVANAAAVRKTKRNGRDVIIVPSATMPDDVVMNGSQGKVLYPADEIANSYRQLERTPAPLGHPMVNGKFVSARDPEGINLGYIGAWNENVRQEDGRVLLDKVIDVEVANRSEGGKAVLAAIEAGGPIHTSTGLLCKLEPVQNNKTYAKIARSLVWDHDAILLNEEGAATPEQGVGMLVNANGESEEIEVINSSLTDVLDQEIDYAGHRLVEALTRREHAGVWERIKTAIMDAFVGTEREPSVNRKEDDMAVSDEQFKALSDEVKTLSESVSAENLGKAIGEAVANAVKPLVDAQAEITANQKAKDDAELTELREKIVKANLMDEAAAGELTLNAARALAPKAEPGQAAALNGAFKGNNDKKAGFKLPAGEKE